MTALPNTQTFSHERSTEALPHAPKLPASGLSGAVSKLESSAARRLGPMRYVDTAMDVAEGIRNGDAKAVGAGLTTAGGAWAGASAGAAIGTLIFPVSAPRSAAPLGVCLAVKRAPGWVTNCSAQPTDCLHPVQ